MRAVVRQLLNVLTGSPDTVRSWIYIPGVVKATNGPSARHHVRTHPQLYVHYSSRSAGWLFSPHHNTWMGLALLQRH